MNVSRLAAAPLALWIGLAAAGTASAQMVDDYIPPETDVSSPENFALEIRVGPYNPAVDTAAFERSFGNDSGPFVGGELDYIPFEIDEIVHFGVGFGFGWAAYQGNTCLDIRCQERASEDTTLTLFPLSAMAVARLTVLPEKLSIPLVFAGKLGYETVRWKASSGGATEASGWSHGIRWGAQVALQLDFLEPRHARQLDEEWGINHSMLFFEYYGSEAEGDSLPVGDTTFAVGLGFII